MLEEYKSELIRRIKCIDICYSTVLRQTSDFLAFIKHQSSTTLSTFLAKKQELINLLHLPSIQPLIPIFKLNPISKLDCSQVCTYYNQRFFEEEKQLDYKNFEEACACLQSEFKFFSVASDITSTVKKLILVNNENLVSAFPDYSLRVSTQDSPFPLKMLKGHKNIIHILTITPDGKYFISASYDKTIIP